MNPWKLHKKLRRADRELAAELKIGLTELRELYGELQLTSVVALDELLSWRSCSLFGGVVG